MKPTFLRFLNKLFLLSVIFSLPIASCKKAGVTVDSSTDAVTDYDYDPLFPADHTVTFNSSPTSFTSYTSSSISLSLNAEPLSQLAQISISINGVEKQILNSSTMSSYTLDLSGQYGTVDIDALATFNDGKFAQGRITLERPLSGENPKLDSNCISDSSYDACIFYKNPVAQKGSAFSPAISSTTNLSLYQVYGVKITGLSQSSALANSNIVVTVSNGIAATPQSAPTYWRKNYHQETGHYTAQLMAYYWLNQMDKVFNFKTGTFFAHGKAMPVDAYDGSVSNNAYFDGNGIVMGYTTVDSSGNSEIALGAEVYLHEMGHANLYYASPSTMSLDSSTHKQDSNGNLLCRTANGCMGAIHEGQADFHSAMMFPENPRLGEHFVNSIGGLTERDVSINGSTTSSQVFSTSGGEIHSMGAVYASILWIMYTHPKMLKIDFQKIFSTHLTLLTASTDFPSAKNVFLSIDKSSYSGKYENIIRKAFAMKGF